MVNFLFQIENISVIFRRTAKSNLWIQMESNPWITVAELMNFSSQTHGKNNKMENMGLNDRWKRKLVGLIEYISPMRCIFKGTPNTALVCSTSSIFSP